MFTFRKIFVEKHKAGEILLQEGVVNYYNLPKHNCRGKAHGMIETHCELEVEEMKSFEAEPDLDG